MIKYICIKRYNRKIGGLKMENRKKPLSEMSNRELYSYRTKLENELTNVLWHINLRKKAKMMGKSKNPESKENN